ncbi:GIY-YIG nuclease family protein [Kaistella pullorum]|uniref:GIY-YIG nuclease family protein n=1 Tax=Kaistella pullorum TaxID=2763074 RepID=A0ABR8WJE7_9FLAO|nr:GIY-YIG nuclease family protein [Kaistella pullorum]MBD8017077.1 GIY-YIG nuclease family protein [Kaistella pullorum]
MERDNGWHTYYVYILTNKNRTVLYTGVTNNLSLRLFQHSSNMNAKSFTSKYKCHFLIYYEKFTWIQEAIAREKEIKSLRRSLKLELIRNVNPNLDFLNEHFKLYF